MRRHRRRTWRGAWLLLMLACACSRTESKGTPHTTQAPSGTASAARAEPELDVHGRTLVLVSNEAGNTVAVIDGTTDELLTTIPVGRRPRGMRLSTDRRRLYVALSGSARGGPGVDESKLPPPDRKADGIGSVDLLHLRLSGVLPSGPDPESFDILPDGKTLIASNEDSATASILDIAGQHPQKAVPVGREPEGLTISPDGRFAYVACEGDDRVDVLDIERRVRTAGIQTAERPRAVLFTKDGKLAYVSTEVGATVEVIDAKKHVRVASIALSGAAEDTTKPRPMGLALSPDERTLYVTTGRAGGIAVVDTRARKVARVFSGIGARPWGIAVSDDGRKLYTANGPSDDVSVVDRDSGAVLTRIPSGKLPWGVVIAAPR